MSRRRFVAGVLMLAGAVASEAQQDASFSGFQFNRSLPGARSLGIGGAFVSLADDATAAYSNPAGLTLLSRREASLEYRHWESQVLFTERGRITGAPSGEGIDTVSGLVLAEESAETDGVSFASYVDARPARRWVVAAYHHVLADFAAAFDSQGVFSEFGGPERFGPFRFSNRFLVDSVGASFAYQFGDCVSFSRCLRFGASVAQFRGRIESREVVLADPPARGPADFSAPGIAFAVREVDDEDVRLNLGLLWETRRVNVGLAYRDGARFDLHERVFSVTDPGELQIPDQVALGISVQPSVRLTLALECDWVRYSELTEGNRLDVLAVDDAAEIRAGVEYVFLLGRQPTTKRLALMAGAWLDPGHRLEFEGELVAPNDPFRAAFFPSIGEDEVHFSAGIGLNLGGLQLDLAADHADTVTTFAFSSVVRFGRGTEAP